MLPPGSNHLQEGARGRAVTVVWRRALLIGGLVVVLTASGMTILVTRNWSKLTAMYRSGVATLSELTRVMAVLERKYGGTVSVIAKQQIGVEGATLSITLVNPPFLSQLDPDGPDGKQKALEMAAAARDALSNDSGYEQFEVLFVRERGVGFTISRSWVFQFRRGDLPVQGEYKSHQ